MIFAYDAKPTTDKHNLEGFTISNEGKLFYYDYDSDKFRKYAKTEFKFIIAKSILPYISLAFFTACAILSVWYNSIPGGGDTESIDLSKKVFILNAFFGLMGIMTSKIYTDKRKSEIYKYRSAIVIDKRLEELVQNHRENEAGFEISRILYVQKTAGQSRIRCIYYDEGVEKTVNIVIKKDIHGYNELLDYCKKFCERTKNKCKQCGTVMIDGWCPNCGSMDAIDEGKNKRMENLTFIILGSIMVIAAIASGFIIEKPSRLLCYIVIIVGVTGVSMTAYGAGVKKDTK